MTTLASVPIGLELWTVRTDVNKDLLSTLSAVARLGYESVEFYSTYLDCWRAASALASTVEVNP